MTCKALVDRGGVATGERVVGTGVARAKWRRSCTCRRWRMRIGRETSEGRSACFRGEHGLGLGCARYQLALVVDDVCFDDDEATADV